QVTMGDQAAVIKGTDMSEEMQQGAVEHATPSLEECNIDRDIAAHIKRISEFNRKYNPNWQCAVGRNFVTHETNHICLGPVMILFLE
ncbi:Dynein light chain 1, cytoplasmic, partial [Phaethon lepturus]